MGQFREYLNESREEIKKEFLKSKYDKKSIDDLMKKGTVYVQYSEPQSRSKKSGADVKSVKNDGVIVDDKFGNVDVLIKFDRITLATNIK